MNPKIYKPEERVSQEVIDKLREDEDYFEQILPNGAEGFIGDVAIITHPDYEYGYSYLMDRSGNKPLLDFGDFKYDQKRHKEIYLNGKTHPDGIFKRNSLEQNTIIRAEYQHIVRKRQFGNVIVFSIF